MFVCQICHVTCHWHFLGMRGHVVVCVLWWQRGYRKDNCLEPLQLFLSRQYHNQHPKMGREFLSQVFVSVSAVPPSEREPTTSASTQPTPRVCSREREPRRWCSKDAIWPEDEEWWSTQDVVYEAFVDGPLAPQVVDHVQVAAHETATVNHLEETLLRRFSTYEREIGIQQTPSSPAATEAPTAIGSHALPSARDTISEEELDNIVLDFVVCDHRDDDAAVDEDFELNWDSEDEMGGYVDSDMQDETPPPSTPVPAVRSLPIPAPSTPAHRAPTTSPATPRSIHVPAHVPSTPILTPRSLSIARVRRFPVHNPRTEVVL